MEPPPRSFAPTKAHLVDRYIIVLYLLIVKTNKNKQGEISDMSENKNEKQLTWADIEVALATEIVEESKKKSKRWFTAWIVTAAALVASNLAWILGGIKK